MRNLIIMMVCFVFTVSSCATTQKTSLKPAKDNTTEVNQSKSENKEMSLEEAELITAGFEESMTKRMQDSSLWNPKSLDDVLEILRTDNMALFNKGVEFSINEEGIKAISLRAQIELAWGEAQMVLSEFLMKLVSHMNATLIALKKKRATGELNALEKEQYQNSKKLIKKTENTADALSRIASEHILVGSRLARKMMKEYPESYLGYRVAADYYRLREEWDDFKKMVEKIKEKNPDSNGLKFVLGVAARHYETDIEKSRKYLEAALLKDPKFTRCRVHLLLLEDTIEKMFEQYIKLKESSPSHQIVIWADDLIEKTYKDWIERKKKKEKADIL